MTDRRVNRWTGAFAINPTNVGAMVERVRPHEPPEARRRQGSGDRDQPTLLIQVEA